MRILVCNWRDTTHPSRGGAETYTHQVLRRLVADGHQATLFSSAVADQPATDVIDGVEHIRSGTRLSVYREAKRWYQSFGYLRRYDVVVDEVNTRPFLCHEWVEPETPVLAFAHQLAREVWNAEVSAPAAAVGRYLLEPRWLKAMRYVPTVTVSESSRRSLVGAGIQRVANIGCGLDPIPPVPVKKDNQPTALFVGRLSRNKRPHHAAEAVRLARPSFPDLRLRVVGSGDLHKRLSGVDGIELMGRVSQKEKFEIMAAAHVLVVTSVREGWGMVVDEAAAMGTPTIGYNVAGLSDSIAAAGGQLVEPRPEALAEALVSSLPGLMRAGTQELSAGTFSWDLISERFAEHLLLVCALHGSHANPPSHTQGFRHDDLLPRS